MALGEICCTIDISKTRRSSKTGFLFFLLLQMSLLSKVWTSSTTAIPENTLTTDATSSTMSEPVSLTQSAAPVSMSSSISTDQMATSGSSVTGASSASIQNTASNSATVVSTGVTSMETVSANTSSSENYTALSCPAFACTNDCYDQFRNTTAKPCQSSENFCKIMKGDAGYSVSCSASCGVSCGNGTLSNCSVNCCNTTNCLNNTLHAMSNSLSTTVATTKPTTTTTTIKTTVPTTPASNGKKCHHVTCNGAACYKSNNVISKVMSCPVGQDYCMLQKTTSGSTESWQAGCSTDCRKMTVCSSTTTACHLECCSATTTLSCLKLTGDVNIPSSATRGPHCPALLMACLLLFWIVKVFT
ncbi:uncharacterized serine-rich protein C215.13-like [Sinocyclocheilus rhinocerous]|uniref:uncharacterized serine-rich protein C215.13-like n=1 Tax=Sinocyclocheilus rhinocerous TaxID=307959 RepID=UPI0007BA279E|nr:PREDICTED: uncharacterized serine-rich protein C215.13-like [Sinocyclocheilus rhinocerous]